MQLIKYHGLGNDYFVLNSASEITPSLARAVCHRHTGPGSDGVLAPTPTPNADFGVRIWNPDGSIAEKSGNGLRIFAYWIYQTTGKRKFTVDTGVCVVRCDVVSSEEITIEMGTAIVGEVTQNFPTPLNRQPLEGLPPSLLFTTVDVGNPHCVVFTDEPLDALPWRQWGPLIETHSQFPHRTNVQFAKRINEHTLEIRIWERGAGETSASGTSSIAVAAAAVNTKLLSPGKKTIQSPGGELTVEVDEALGLLLTGPIVVIGDTYLDPRWLAAVPCV